RQVLAGLDPLGLAPVELDATAPGVPRLVLVALLPAGRARIRPRHDQRRSAGGAALLELLEPVAAGDRAAVQDALEVDLGPALVHELPGVDEARLLEQLT